MSKTVFVGLSGGVDSAVSAALLKQRGYDVVGVFIKIWQPQFIECTWKEDRLDAMRVAASLRIPFREIDLSDEYRREVVDTMIRDYQSGSTPNPDVLCNRYIKFGSFLQWALREGADYVATGHYARIIESGGRYELHRGADMQKDQSYFLHQLRGEDLPRIIFPVGELEKSRVRTLASRFDLPVAERPDSQGLCFVGDVSMREFLGRYIRVETGNVIDMKGAVIGTHDGATLYTIGQRHGFATHGTDAHYVVAINAHENTLRVSRERMDAVQERVGIQQMHWINEQPSYPLSAMVQSRYREKSFAATIDEEGDALKATFDALHLVSPGQSLVLYLPAQAGDGTRCLGGGMIVKSRT